MKEFSFFVYSRWYFFSLVFICIFGIEIIQKLIESDQVTLLGLGYG